MTIATHDLVRRCRAHRTNGDECSAFAIRGGTVCVVHGGRAPQVKRSAQERLEQMIDPALVQLGKLIEQADSDSVKLAAIKDVLDRVHGRPQQRVDVTTQGQPLIKAVPADDLALLSQ